jgi:tRNA 2-thiouridine synthesizing protein D
VDAALRRGHDVNVFAYEGAVSLPFAKQAPHANVVHGREVADEDHPNPKDWIAALYQLAESKSAKLDWVQCGLCVDERGAAECIPGPRRGSPADLVKFSEASHATLVIPTK